MAMTMSGMRAGAAVAAIGLAMTGAAAVAQDASPEATPAATMEAAGGQSHPAHIHTGTCDEIGDVVFPLSNVGVPQSDATPMAEETGGGAVGSELALPAFVSITQLDASLEDILSGEHVINVHESEENIGNYIACGEIGGIQQGDTLYFGLRELNGSGYTGVGLISGDPDGSTNVVVYLSQTGSGAADGAGGEAMAEGTPSA